MKKFIIKTNVFVIIFLLQNSMYARQALPSNNLVAYHNKIIHMSYEQGDDIMMVMQSQVDPICMYTPLHYTEHGVVDRVKTYFFPRTTLTNIDVMKFVKKLDVLGIDLKIDEIHGKNYGVQMLFAMKSDHLYNIVKNIDHHQKTVTFNFIKKI